MWYLNDWFSVLLSLRVAFISLVVVVLFALPLARILGLYEFRGRDILEAIFTLPLVLPPSVVGYGLLVFIGRNGIVGKYFADMGLTLFFSWWAVVLAASVVAFPLMYQSCREPLPVLTAVMRKRPVLWGPMNYISFPGHSAPGLARHTFRSGVDLARALGNSVPP